jgi:hypothetical protein
LRCFIFGNSVPFECSKNILFVWEMDKDSTNEHSQKETVNDISNELWISQFWWKINKLRR